MCFVLNHERARLARGSQLLGNASFCHPTKKRARGVPSAGLRTEPRRETEEIRRLLTLALQGRNPISHVSSNRGHTVKSERRRAARMSVCGSCIEGGAMMRSKKEDGPIISHRRDQLLIKDVDEKESS